MAQLCIAILPLEVYEVLQSSTALHVSLTYLSRVFHVCVSRVSHLSLSCLTYLSRCLVRVYLDFFCHATYVNLQLKNKVQE